MALSSVEPLAEISIPPAVAGIPKADLHLHARAVTVLYNAIQAAFVSPARRAALLEELDEPNILSTV
jgi:hypothetical protein